MAGPINGGRSNHPQPVPKISPQDRPARGIDSQRWSRRCYRRWRDRGHEARGTCRGSFERPGWWRSRRIAVRARPDSVRAEVVQVESESRPNGLPRHRAARTDEGDREAARHVANDRLQSGGGRKPGSRPRAPPCKIPDRLLGRSRSFWGSAAVNRRRRTRVSRLPDSKCADIERSRRRALWMVFGSAAESSLWSGQPRCHAVTRECNSKGLERSTAA